MTERGWRARAACRFFDSEVFFSPSHHSTQSSTQSVLKLCGSCPVALECLAYAVATEPPFGIWSGRTPDQICRLASRHPDPRSLISGPDQYLIRFAHQTLSEALPS